MRDLNWNELSYVSGAGDSPTPPTDCSCTCPEPEHGKSKGNNGFGNGAYDGVPGKSGFTDATR